MYKICWSGLADKNYYEYIAKYCLPSWKKLPGEKSIIHDDNAINHQFLNIINQNNVLNKDCKFLKTNPKKKTHNFWRKMQSQVWAMRNLSSCDLLVLLDTDIEIMDFFDERKFYQEMKKFKKSNMPWATGRSQSRLHDSGVIVLNPNHLLFEEITDYYENIWESGDIYKLRKSYDGNAVESMFEKYPSYKIMNTDYGKGMHVYDLGFVHYGSKIPKSLRSSWTGDPNKLIEEYISKVNVKKYKN